jgi:hypothetical protein
MNPEQPRPLRAALPILLLISVLLGAACTQEGEVTATLVTNRPEFTSYAEQFNIAQDEYRIIVEYTPTPRSRVRAEQSGADLIIDTQLNSSTYLPHLATLEKLFMDERLAKEWFYSSPLEQGVYEGQQVLLPISFVLPAVLRKKSLELEDAPAFFYSIDDIKRLSRSFNRKRDEAFTAMGYAPSWQADMLYIMTLLKGAAYRESSGSVLLWNGERLRAALEEIRAWPEEVNESRELQQRFTEKFLYEPPLKLLRQERILFHYSDSSSFYRMPPEQREDLESHWLATDGNVPVLSNVLFAGIPHGADGIEAARAFLGWFFQSENQEQMIRNGLYKQLRQFGIAGGFSSLHRVNEEVLPRFYPSLVGHTPRENYLSFPPPLPPEWPSIKEEVIKPWLVEQTRESSAGSSLAEKLDTWLKQRPTGQQ